MKKWNNFSGLNERGILGQLGMFGEELAIQIIGGQRTTGTEENYPFADVVNTEARIAVQVKISNARHAQRPLPSQVFALAEEIESSWLFEYGVYFLIFYGGVHQEVCRKGKSMIWSRKLNKDSRRRIVWSEIQYIYIVDVMLLKNLASNHDGKFLRKGNIFFVPDEKPDRTHTLHLNRNFLRGFLGRKHRRRGELHRAILEETFGHCHWQSSSLTFPIELRTEEQERTLVSEVPIHIVGSRSLVRQVVNLLRERISNRSRS